MGQMLQHKQCYPSRCFKGSHGKTLSKCKYGFPYKVPEPCETLDQEMVRYLYPRALKEDALVVPHNPEIAVLWRASHNVQKVSKHGFEQYLAKYISKPEPSCSIQLPENASEPQRFLRTRVIGSVEALEVLMGFHQSQMSRQVLFLHTEMNPAQRMLKPTYQLSQLEDEDSDIYLQTKFQTYLKRPSSLYSLTYPEFYRWWRSATSAEQRKAESEHADDAYSLNSKGSDDFSEFMCAKTTRDGARVQLSELLDECEVNIKDAEDLLALTRTLTRLAVPQRVIDCVQQYYVEQGINRLHQCPTEASYQVAEALLECIDLEDSDLIKQAWGNWGGRPGHGLANILDHSGFCISHRRGHTALPHLLPCHSLIQHTLPKLAWPIQFCFPQHCQGPVYPQLAHGLQHEGGAHNCPDPLQAW